VRTIIVRDGAGSLLYDLDFSLLAGKGVRLEAMLRNPEQVNSACMRFSRFQVGDKQELVQVDYRRLTPLEKSAGIHEGDVREIHDSRVFPCHLVAPPSLPEYIQIDAEGIPAIELARRRIIPEAQERGYRPAAPLVLRAMAGGKDRFYHSIAILGEHTIATVGRATAELRQPSGLEWISEEQFQALSRKYQFSMISVV